MAGGSKDQASSSNSTTRTSFVYQVFLSFRGESRLRIISHLRKALEIRGVKIFYDEKNLKRGEDIQWNLHDAIRNSKLSIVTFSPEYASSRWCLDELSEILKSKKYYGHIVLPLFYEVDPSDLRKADQEGTYKDAFEKHKVKFEKSRVDDWKVALKRAADLSGFTFEKSKGIEEAEFIDAVVKEVMKKVHEPQLSTPKHMIKLPESVDSFINFWFGLESPEYNTCVIYGPAGVGKTTIAKKIYNDNYYKFDSSSFLSGIRTASTDLQEVIRLQEQLIGNILGPTKIQSVEDGKKLVKNAIKTRNILVVFDDVDEKNQLDNFFDSPQCFAAGSKILITSRKESLARQVGQFPARKLQARKLSDEDSTKLFYLHAFSPYKIRPEFEEISDQFVEYCDGLPREIEIWATRLKGEKKDTWTQEFAKLKDNRLNYSEYEKELKSTFDALDETQVAAFLHIAFFMVGMDEKLAIMILESCRLHGEVVLKNLKDRSYVSVDKHTSTLKMDRVKKKMCYEVVHRESPTNKGKQSRLSNCMETEQVLENETGRSSVKGLHFSGARNSLTSFNTSAFRKMGFLDLLLLENVQLVGGFEGFPKRIKWLKWHGCKQSLPTAFVLDDVVVLDMQNNLLLQAWENSKSMTALRNLDLSYSSSMVCTPDLSGAPLLECLFLRYCSCLVMIHESLGGLQNLLHLNVEGCVSLMNLPISIDNLKKLTILNLKECKKLKPFCLPVSVEELVHDGWPSSLPITSSLPVVTSHAYLRNLNLASCNISRDDVLELLSGLVSFETLDLSHNPIRKVENTHKLRFYSLTLEHCTELESILQLPRACRLNVQFCSSLKKISFNDDGRPSECILSFECPKLEEIKYDCHDLDRLVIDNTIDMNEARANYLGFPGLTSRVHENDRMDIDMVKPQANYFGKGYYRAGIYQVILDRDYQLINNNWIRGEKAVWGMRCIVPAAPNKKRIRALILHLSPKYYIEDDEEFPFCEITIKNKKKNWEWGLASPYGCEMSWGLDNNKRMKTWLSHWRINKHRELEPEDILKISCLCNSMEDPVEVDYRVRFIYEDEEDVVATWYNKLLGFSDDDDYPSIYYRSTAGYPWNVHSNVKQYLVTHHLHHTRADPIIFNHFLF